MGGSEPKRRFCDWDFDLTWHSLELRQKDFSKSRIAKSVYLPVYSVEAIGWGSNSHACLNVSQTVRAVRAFILEVEIKSSDGWMFLEKCKETKTHLVSF